MHLNLRCVRFSHLKSNPFQNRSSIELSDRRDLFCCFFASFFWDEIFGDRECLLAGYGSWGNIFSIK